MITLEEAKQLQYGDILHDSRGRRWKVNGKVKTWVTMPNRVYVPIKHGLYTYDSLSESNFFNGECDLLTKGEPSGE